MKPWLKAVLVLAAVAAGIAALFFWESKREAAMTAEAEATVTKVTFVRDEESSSLDSTDIHYAFDANGVRTESKDSLPGDKVEAYTIGRKIRICYNPEKPTDTAMLTGEGKCGG